MLVARRTLAQGWRGEARAGSALSVFWRLQVKHPKRAILLFGPLHDKLLILGRKEASAGSIHP
jgi:hypothetical protein